MTYISINAHTIRHNAKHGTSNPPIRIAKTKHDKKPRYAKQVSITGPSKLIYSPNKPILGCGARMVLVVKEIDVFIVE